MLFVAKWMQLENIICEVNQRQIPYDITYMYNVKKTDTNELIYKTEIDSQAQKTNLSLPKGKGEEE